MDKMFLLADSDPKFVYEYAQKQVDKWGNWCTGITIIGSIVSVLSIPIGMASVNRWIDLLPFGIPLGLTVIFGLLTNHKWDNAILLRNFTYNKYKPILDKEKQSKDCRAQEFIKNNPDLIELATAESIQEKVMTAVTKHMDQCGIVDKDAVIGELTKSK